MDRRERQPLAGCTILSSFAWKRGLNECECCGHTQTLTNLLTSRTPDNAFIAVRLIHWGDDFTDTVEKTYLTCPACWDDDNRLIGFLLSHGYLLLDEYKSKFAHLIPNSTDNQ
jgi:hypothetical protein